MRHVLASQLRNHVSLASVKKKMVFPADSITCLSALSSLHLRVSVVKAEWEKLSTLTNVILLDVNGTRCLHPEPRHGDAALALFVAWNRLRVLRVSRCNMFPVTASAETALEELSAVLNS